VGSRIGIFNSYGQSINLTPDGLPICQLNTLHEVMHNGDGVSTLRSEIKQNSNKSNVAPLANNLLFSFHLNSS